MAAHPPVKLTKRAVDALSVVSGDTVVWDRDLPGFGVRVYASGRKVWCVQTRGPAGGPKRVALGRVVDMPPDEARRKAVEVIDRIKQGLDPVPPPPAPEPTVADLAERYMEAHLKVNCRPATVENFGRVVRFYILPELGGLKLSEVDRPQVSALHHKLRDKPYQANATVMVLAKMFRLAESLGHDAAAAQSLPLDQALQGDPPRAVPDPGGIPYARPRARRGRGRRLGVSDGGPGDPPAVADGLPEERDRHPEVGRCGPHGGRAPAPRRQVGGGAACR